MMCQRSTNAVSFMFRELGFHCTNYIDDFGGAEIPEKSDAAFHALGSLLADLGLDTSPDKASPPATAMVFLGVLVNTDDMTTRTPPPERLHELFNLFNFLTALKHSTRPQFVYCLFPLAR